MNKPLNLFIDKQQNFLGFLKTRFNVIHESNVFFRDLHYGVMAFLQMNNLPHRYSSSEELTRRVIEAYEESKTFLKIDERTWMLNYVPFKKPSTNSVPAPKPASKPVASSSPAASRATSQNVLARPVEVQGERVG